MKTLEETIQKLKNNNYQYASAGDVRRLLERIEELEMIYKNRGVA